MSGKLKYFSLSNISVSTVVAGVAEAMANIFGPCLSAVELSDHAIELAMTLSPLIGMESKKGQCEIIGGLRSFYLIKQLRSCNKVPVIVLPQDLIPNPKIFAAQLALVDVVLGSIHRHNAVRVFPLLWEALEHRENRTQISSRFGSMSAVAEAMGVNRRELSKKPRPFRSEFLEFQGGKEW